MEIIIDVDDLYQCVLWNESDWLFYWQFVLMIGDVLIVKIVDEVVKMMDQLLWKWLKDDGIYDVGWIWFYVFEYWLIYEVIVFGDVDVVVFYVEQYICCVWCDIVLK